MSNINKPKVLQEPNYKSLNALCVSYVDTLSKNGYMDEDLNHYIFEEAMTAIFGYGVWEWINSHEN